MGHAIDYIRVDKKKDILPAAQRYAAENVDRQEDPAGSYHGHLTVHDSPILDSAQDAYDWIRSVDRGFYDDHAVQFKDCDSLKPTKEMLAIRGRAQDNRMKKREYSLSHGLAQLHKSQYVSCKACGSRLAMKYMDTRNRCPVCGKTLLPQYVLDRLKKFDEDEEALHKKYEELNKKRKDRAPVRWLVKVEVHC